ncbi:hypothetical protein DVH24_008328 [Malus domestica]|uniref:RNase H type-1 domain-containing protein n=1 Tax=Malus domestica TaxID=3750 RepID=A0A498JJE4_MALDO|nr:hypothetical protein DVH24_008328 [Malus domestica]
MKSDEQQKWRMERHRLWVLYWDGDENGLMEEGELELQICSQGRGSFSRISDLRESVSFELGAHRGLDLCPKPQVDASRAMDWCQEFLRINHTSTSVDRWASRPPPNRLKANVDGVWVPNSTVGGVGVVIHDSDGGFIGAASFNFQEVFSPAQIEALAIVSTLNDSSTNLSTIGPIIEDAKLFMEMIAKVSIAHSCFKPETHGEKSNKVSTRIVDHMTQSTPNLQWIDL